MLASLLSAVSFRAVTGRCREGAQRESHRVGSDVRPHLARAKLWWFPCAWAEEPGSKSLSHGHGEAYGATPVGAEGLPFCDGR